MTLKQKNITVAMDGVGGTISMPLSLKLAMKMSGDVDHSVRVFFWTHGVWQPIKDLTDRAHIEVKSDELYALLSGLIADGHNVYLVAKSGGCIVALRALERLSLSGVDASVGSVVLLSPAISPDYDLTAALSAVSGSLHSFYSVYDRLYLDLGTTIFGTSDGVKGPSAGCIGFRPADADCGAGRQFQYAKLRQVPWHPSMLKLLHVGLHLGNSMLPWLIRHVVPVLREGCAQNDFTKAAPVS
ncbi:MAG: hypothetical protein KGS72_04025 [Cyanobacteria bacterium REEB67]|nr:hypothetical protein [Cyanobacteria bacterium REEB67]